MVYFKLLRPTLAEFAFVSWYKICFRSVSFFLLFVPT